MAIFPTGCSPTSTDNSNLDPLDWDDNVEEGTGDHNPPNGEVAEAGTSVQPIDLTAPVAPLAKAATAADVPLVEMLVNVKPTPLADKIKAGMANMDPVEMEKHMELDNLPNRAARIFKVLSMHPSEDRDPVAEKISWLQHELDKLKAAKKEQPVKAATAAEESDKELLLFASLQGQSSGSHPQIPKINISGAGTSAAAHLVPVNTTPTGGMVMSKNQKLGYENAQFYNRYRNDPDFDVDAEKYQLALLPEEQRENVRLMDIIMHATISKLDRLQADTDNLKTHLSVDHATKMALVESDIARLEKQLANRKAEAMEMATAFETTGNNLQESADSQWEEIHKSLYTELEELARDPPTPCPGHVAYLKQVGRPVSFMDKRTWVDLVGQLHCVSDHYLYHCESVDMDIIDGNDINNNIDIYINKMINTCAGEEDNNPNNNNNLDGSGAGTSGGTGGSTGGGNPSSTPLHVNGDNINNDNNEISLCPLGYTPGSNIVSSQVKCMVLCTVNNDNYILFIKNN